MTHIWYDCALYRPLSPHLILLQRLPHHGLILGGKYHLTLSHKTLAHGVLETIVRLCLWHWISALIFQVVLKRTNLHVSLIRLLLYWLRLWLLLVYKIAIILYTLKVGLLLLIHLLTLDGIYELVHQVGLVGVVTHLCSTLLRHAWPREGKVPLAIKENWVVNGEGPWSSQILHLDLKSSLSLSLCLRLESRQILLHICHAWSLQLGRPH